MLSFLCMCRSKLLSTPITDKEKQQEWNTICTIAKNNDLPLQLIHNFKKTRLLEHNRQKKPRTNNKEKMDNIHLS